MVLMQNLVEHLHKYFTLKTSEYFEQLLGDDNLDNFRVVFGDYLQQHKVLKVKSSCQTLLNVLEISRTGTIILMGG